MAARVESFSVTIPAGTARVSPVTIATAFSDGVLEAIEVDVPPGPSGLLGFAFQHSLQQIIPRTSGAWIIVHDVHLRWPTEDYPTGGKWSVVGYNTDIYPHTIQVRYMLNELSLSSPASITLRPIP